MITLCQLIWSLESCSSIKKCRSGFQWWGRSTQAGFRRWIIQSHEPTLAVRLIFNSTCVSENLPPSTHQDPFPRENLILASPQLCFLQTVTISLPWLVSYCMQGWQKCTERVWLYCTVGGCVAGWQVIKPHVFNSIRSPHLNQQSTSHAQHTRRMWFIGVFS